MINHDDLIDPNFSLGVDNKISIDEFLNHLNDDLRSQRLFDRRGYITSNDFTYLTADKIGLDVLSDEDRLKEWLNSVAKGLNIDNARISGCKVFPYTCILFDAKRHSDDEADRMLKDMVQ